VTYVQIVGRALLTMYEVADRMWPKRGPGGFQTFTDGFLFLKLNRTLEMDFYVWLRYGLRPSKVNSAF
jgi:hypothetical protein